jgi:Holliday junction resolvase-like predicted endonuclease
VLSQSNVRRIKAGVSIEELAEDEVRPTDLRSLRKSVAVVHGDVDLLAPKRQGLAEVHIRGSQQHGDIDGSGIQPPP